MRYVTGLVGAIVGFFLSVAALSYMAKPSNMSVSVDPFEAISTYFFSFSWVGGTVGIIVGAVLLAGYLALWYIVGIKIYSALTGM